MNSNVEGLTEFPREFWEGFTSVANHSFVAKQSATIWITAPTVALFRPVVSKEHFRELREPSWVSAESWIREPWEPGFGGGDWKYMCKKLREAPSAYVDTSGSVTDEGMFEFAVKQLGAGRMLFATDR